jgi:hypothetical protein
VTRHSPWLLLFPRNSRYACTFIHPFVPSMYLIRMRSLRPGESAISSATLSAPRSLLAPGSVSREAPTIPRNGELTRGRRRRARSDLHSPSARQSWLSGASPAPRSLARIGRSNRIGREMDARHRRGPTSEGFGPRRLAGPLRRRSLKPRRVSFEIRNVH